MIRINKQRRNAKQSGQGMTEYIIIVGLIAIFLITAVNKFSGALSGTYEAAKSKLETDVTGAINGESAGAAGAGAGAVPAGGN